MFSYIMTRTSYIRLNYYDILFMLKYESIYKHDLVFCFLEIKFFKIVFIIHTIVADIMCLSAVSTCNNTIAIHNLI